MVMVGSFNGFDRFSIEGGKQRGWGGHRSEKRMAGGVVGLTSLGAEESAGVLCGTAASGFGWWWWRRRLPEEEDEQHWVCLAGQTDGLHPWLGRMLKRNSKKSFEFSKAEMDGFKNEFEFWMTVLDFQKKNRKLDKDLNQIGLNSKFGIFQNRISKLIRKLKSRNMKIRRKEFKFWLRIWIRRKRILTSFWISVLDLAQKLNLNQGIWTSMNFQERFKPILDRKFGIWLDDSNSNQQL
jgi:hypothetical protein